MKTAFFWIVSHSFLDEASESATSFRKADEIHARAATFVFIEGDRPSRSREIFDQAISLNQIPEKHWFLRSTGYFVEALEKLRELDFEIAVYLDCDTYVLGDLSPLVHLAHRFDFSGAHAPGRRTRATVLDVPSAFPEINVGVNTFHLNDNTIQTVKDWFAYYLQNVETYGNNDQASLREILWLNRLQIRTAVLPPEFNFRFGFGGFLRGPCKILHGRCDDIERVARQVNKSIDFRTFQRGELC